MNNNTLNGKDIFFKIIFILNALIYIIKFENSLCTPTYDCNSPNQTRIELIFTGQSNHPKSFYKLSIPLKTTPFTPLIADLSSINKHSLNHYNNCIRYQIKYYKSHFDFNHQIISILQKNNIWHQSSDEDSHRLS